ncbi:MAG: hypothetical protein IJ278_06250 [Clostridia bacterium]|nr:hypothetical protein [Clostridia bacterium]
MIKKSTTLFLILTLILSSFSIVSAGFGTNQVVSELNIMPESCKSDTDNLVTRRDFAFTISNILGGTTMDPRATEYVDIGEDVADSGYIDYATKNGFLVPNGTLFMPDEPISFHDYNEAVVRLLAYEEIAAKNGGGTAGNLKTVMELGLYEGVQLTNYDTVTVRQYRKLIYKLLTARINNFVYTYEPDGGMTASKVHSTRTILSEYFGISRYYGTIVEVNNTKPSAKVKIELNACESNPVMLEEDLIHSFLSNGKIDMNFYKNIPVEIWVNRDGVMLYVAPQPTVEVFYDVIQSVNNDDNEKNAYAINLVDKVELKNRDRLYDVSNSCVLNYNGEATKYPVKLASKFAKVVVISDKVTYIETWDLQEGGLVTEINNSFIAFTKGEGSGRIKNVGEYNDIVVVVEGRSTDRDHIKPNSMCWYYQTDEDLIVVCSEKAVVGTFDSYSAEELEIGRSYYPIKGPVYYSENGIDYYPTIPENLTGAQVICYIDIFGNVKYVKPDSRLKKINEFTGYVMGHYQESAFDDVTIKIQQIYPEIGQIIVSMPQEFSENKFVDNEQVDFWTKATLIDAFKPENLAGTALNWASRDDAYKKLFKFTINDNNVITRIAEPDYYLIAGNNHQVQKLPDDGSLDTYESWEVPAVPAVNLGNEFFTGDFRGVYSTITVGTDTTNNKILLNVGGDRWGQQFYIGDDRFFVLHNLGGTMGVKEVSYSDMQATGSQTGSALGSPEKMALFAKPGADHADFWFIYGDTSQIYAYNSNSSGEITYITTKYDAETDETYHEVILDDGELILRLDTLSPCEVTYYNEKGALVTAVAGTKDLEVGMILSYHSGAKYADNGIIITSARQITMDGDAGNISIEEWLQSNTDTAGMYKAEIKKVGDYRLYVVGADGEEGAYWLGDKFSITGLKRENGKLKTVSLREDEVPSGAIGYFNSVVRVQTLYIELTD